MKGYDEVSFTFYVLQRVRARCERIYGRMRHFPSELARSRSALPMNSHARLTALHVGKVLALYMQSQNVGGTAEICFSVPNP